MGTSEPIRIETLSVQPRVFELHNFITPAEADELVHNARVYMTTFDGLNSSSSSSTEDPYRQADLAYDISSAAAMGVKRRLFDLLGIFPFQEAMTDGMQVCTSRVVVAVAIVEVYTVYSERECVGLKFYSTFTLFMRYRRCATTSPAPTSRTWTGWSLSLRATVAVTAALVLRAI